MQMVKMTRAHVVFGASWLAYASSYFLRKPVGVLKPAMENQLGFSTSLLGFLDVALLLPYALVQVHPSLQLLTRYLQKIKTEK